MVAPDAGKSDASTVHAVKLPAAMFQSRSNFPWPIKAGKCNRSWEFSLEAIATRPFGGVDVDQNWFYFGGLNYLDYPFSARQFGYADDREYKHQLPFLCRSWCRVLISANVRRRVCDRGSWPWRRQWWPWWSRRRGLRLSECGH